MAPKTEKTTQPNVTMVSQAKQDMSGGASGAPMEMRQIDALRADSAEALISQALTNGVPVETIERLLAMRRELKQEWAKQEYDTAMAQFQADCPTIVKTKEVKTDEGKIAYRYAPIESIVEQVKVPLRENGFSYSTSMELKETGVKVTVKVTHSSGHSELTPMEVPFGNKTRVMSQSQVAAAASTFAKRYAFCNAFGILTGDEDTDARPVVEKPKEPESSLDFRRAVRAIEMTKESGPLIHMAQKLGGSNFYNLEEKAKLEVLISERITTLDNG